MNQCFEELFEARVEILLRSPETFLHAIDELHEIYTIVKTAEEKSLALQMIGTINTSLAVQALNDGNTEQGQKHFVLSEEYLCKAIEQDASRAEPRLNLARYYLTFGNEPKKAYESLCFSDELLARDDFRIPLALEHQRVALQGVSLAFQGKAEQAIHAFDQAYGEEMLARLDQREVDTSSLEYLAIRSIYLAPASVEAFLERLQHSGAVHIDRICALREKLIEKNDAG